MFSGLWSEYIKYVKLNIMKSSTGHDAQVPQQNTLVLLGKVCSPVRHSATLLSRSPIFHTVSFVPSVVLALKTRQTKHFCAVTQHGNPRYLSVFFNTSTILTGRYGSIHTYEHTVGKAVAANGLSAAQFTNKMWQFSKNGRGFAPDAARSARSIESYEVSCISVLVSSCAGEDASCMTKQS